MRVAQTGGVTAAGIMTRAFLRLCAIGLIALLAVLLSRLAGASADTFALPAPSATVLSEDNAAALEERLSSLFLAYDTMGGSVAVIENGEVTYTYCYGLRESAGDPVTPDSAFQVGSISKMIAAMGLMQLWEKGTLSLEDDLSDVLGLPIRSPYYPNTPVTLRQLMTHTAALRDSSYYDAATEGRGKALSTLFEKDKIYDVFQRGVKPGKKSVYSNFGGGLVGVIIEALSGQTLDDYMKLNVFDPLQITAAYQARLLPETTPLCDIYFMPSGALAKRLQEDDTRILTPDVEHDYYLTAGKLIISAPDLAKLLIVLCDGGVYRDARLLKEATVKEMTTPQNLRGSVQCDSGRGLFMNILTDDQVEGRTLYGHGGKAYGMLCAAYFDPSDRTGVVMLTNGCQNQLVYHDVGMLGRDVLTAVYDALEAGGYQETDPFAVE